MKDPTEWEREFFPSWVKADPESGLEWICDHLMQELRARTARKNPDFGDFELRTYLVCKALKKRLQGPL